MERVRFLVHQGKRILFVDYTNSTSDEMLQTLAEAERLVATEPAGSLLTLCDFSGAQVDKRVADRLKVVATKDTPYVRRAAFVSADRIADVYYRALRSFSGRDFPNFSSREEALDWLASEEQQQVAS